MNKIELNPPAGTRDFFPEEMAVRNWLFGIWKKLSKSYGGKEYDGPVMENIELYKRKGGDDITKEMFIVNDEYHKETTDKNAKYSLRPEMTPTLVRMCLSLVSNMKLPLRLYGTFQCWRNEDTSSQRKREHYQWNYDIVGLDNYKAEIEVLDILVKFLKEVGFKSTDVTIKISNRQIFQKLFDDIGMDHDLFEEACNILDKFNKVSEFDTRNSLKNNIHLKDTDIDTIFKVMKSTTLEEIEAVIGTTKSLTDLQTIFKICNDLQINEWIKLDPSIFRGLSYYSGMVFEGFCNLPDFRRAMFGGGRYDNLFTTYGHHENVPCVGFGFGDVVIVEVLRKLNLIPVFNLAPDYLVIPFTDELYSKSLDIANILRHKYSVEVYSKKTKLWKSYEYADSVGINQVILVAPDELNKGQVKLKKMNVDDKDPNKESYINLSDLNKL